MTDWRDPSWYAARLPRELMTPALAIYPDAIRQNVHAALKLFNGDASRWRPHLKTVKAAFAMRLMVELGVTQAKCATLLELETACASGFRDVVVSMSLVGPAVQAAQAVTAAYPQVKIAALVEAPEHVKQWQGTGFRLLIDINPGMNRTGLDQELTAVIVERARQIRDAGCTFAGLHYYDGHLTDDDMQQRCATAHEGYRKLLGVCSGTRSRRHRCAGSHHGRYADVSLLALIRRFSGSQLPSYLLARNDCLQRPVEPVEAAGRIRIPSCRCCVEPRHQPSDGDNDHAGRGPQSSVGRLRRAELPGA